MIYFDHNATTPVAEEAAAAMAPFFTEKFGNPSTDYDLGREAKWGLEKARADVAASIGAEPGEIVFTSGGTESNNQVLKGVFYQANRPVHIITTRIEHPAIMNPALFLLNQGADVTFLHVDGAGLVDPDDVRRAFKPETALVSVMLANNETGVLQPVREIGLMTRERGVLLHTDAAQALGKIPVDVKDLHADLLSVAGHKLYAPKGVGALYIRSGVALEPCLHGAGQESGRRAGTESAALAVGLGTAARLASKRLPEEGPRLAQLRDRLEELLRAEIPDLVLAGHPDLRLPNTLNVCFPELIGSDILAAAPEIRASTGSACHAGEVKISPVLSAMGMPSDIAAGAVRLSLGRLNRPEQIQPAAQALVRAARSLSRS